MKLPRKQRFQLKKQILDQLESNTWDVDQINLLLTEFDLPVYTADWNGLPLSECLADTNDDDLLDIASTVLEFDRSDMVSVASIGNGNGNGNAGSWKPGYVRVFLSHAAVRRAEVARVAEELLAFGAHGFVAHADMKVSLSWQEQIKDGLRSMQAFVALVHPELNGSTWCEQEIGWAMGRKVPYFAVRIGADPAGFLGSQQWPSVSSGDEAEIAGHIGDWLSDLPVLRESAADGLITALKASGSFADAGSVARRLAKLAKKVQLSDEQFSRIDHVWHTNVQVTESWKARESLAGLYRDQKKVWPPPACGAAH